MRLWLHILIISLLIGVAACATSITNTTNGSEPVAVTQSVTEGVGTNQDECLKAEPGGKTTVNPNCIRADVAVAKGVTLESLGTVAVATFEMVSIAQLSGTKKIIKSSHPEDSGLTDTFTRRLLDAGVMLVERERNLIDKTLEELEYSTSSLVDISTSPEIGQQLGAQTLIVGRYEFSGEFDYATNEKGDLVIQKPVSIGVQRIRIKALDITKGQIIMDAEFSMTGKVVNVLMPRTLAQFGAGALIERLDGAESYMP